MRPKLVLTMAALNAPPLIRMPPLRFVSEYMLVVLPRASTASDPKRKELIAKLAARYPQLVAKDAELAVKMILDSMATSLAQGERIEIRGFGSFGLNYRPPRVGRNPKSGEKVQVPEKYVPHFKAGKELRERVDSELEAAAKQAQALR